MFIICSIVYLNKLFDKYQKMVGHIINYRNTIWFGFRPGRGMVEVIFIVRQFTEKAQEHRGPLHLNFVDCKASFDTAWRKAPRASHRYLRAQNIRSWWLLFGQPPRESEGMKRHKHRSQVKSILLQIRLGNNLAMFEIINQRLN